MCCSRGNAHTVAQSQIQSQINTASSCCRRSRFCSAVCFRSALPVCLSTQSLAVGAIASVPLRAPAMVRASVPSDQSGQSPQSAPWGMNPVPPPAQSDQSAKSPLPPPPWAQSAAREAFPCRQSVPKAVPGTCTASNPLGNPTNSRPSAFPRHIPRRLPVS